MGGALSLHAAEEQQFELPLGAPGAAAGEQHGSRAQRNAPRARHQLWTGLGHGGWRVPSSSRGERGGGRLRRSRSPNDAGESAQADGEARGGGGRSMSLSISNSWRRRKLRRAWFSGEHEPVEPSESSLESVSATHTSPSDRERKTRGECTARARGGLDEHDSDDAGGEDVDLEVSLFTPAIDDIAALGSPCTFGSSADASIVQDHSTADTRLLPSLAELCLESLRKQLTNESCECSEEFGSAGQLVDLIAFEKLPADIVQSLASYVIRSSTMSTAERVLARICNNAASGVSQLEVRQRSYDRDYRPTDSLLVPVSQLSSSLERLDLRGSLFVTDAALPFLACAKGLRYLDLSGCVKLSSAGCRYLACLKRLQVLKLSALPRLDEFAAVAISKLTDLRVLHLDQCPLLDDDAVRHFAHLQECSELVLAYCFQITDDALASAVSAMPNLTVLDVASTRAGSAMLGALRASKALSRLVVLRLSGCIGIDDQDGASWAAELASIRELDVARTATGDALVKRLRGLQSLQALDLSYTNVSDRPLVDTLATLSNLRRLRLESCRLISDFALEAGVSLLRTLRDLDLSDTAVSSYGVSDLKALKQLRTLNLARTHIADHALDSLTSVQSIAQLDLDCAGVTDDALRRVAHFDSLRELSLFSARISDRGLTALEPLQRLQSLEICSGLLTNRGMERLAKLRSLESLNVAHNARVGSSGIANLAGLSKLRLLNIGFTSVNDELVSILSHRDGDKFASLQALALSGCVRVSQRARQKLARLSWLSLIGAEIVPPEIPILPPRPAGIRLPPELAEDDDEVEDGAVLDLDRGTDSSAIANIAQETQAQPLNVAA
uniref:Disease resistance R13L4/SHOC-2-like LRR domain-containing protein n=1 Tax=Erythrolobus australicus TaxID=1077150 RepID=A0A7S1TN79_9RHOD